MKQRNTSDGRNSLVWQLVEKLDEQRQYPRVPLASEVGLRNVKGEEFSALLVNISPDGVQLRCDVEGARLAHPAGGRIDPQNTAPLELDLTLPVSIAAHQLRARCQLLYLTTVDSEPRCVFGLRFVDLGEEAERVLSAFFCDQLGTGGTADAA